MAEIVFDQELKDCLPKLADDLAAHISEQDPDHCEELLSAFVSQLFLQAEYLLETPGAAGRGHCKGQRCAVRHQAAGASG